jgi:hypothetical protein
VPVTGAKMRCLDRGERRDLLLQLEHDSLRRLLADPRNGLEESVVLANDGAPKLARRIAGHDRERDLGPDSRNREQLLEELALVLIREAEELHRVLAHVEVRLEDDFIDSVGPLRRRRSREEPVADAIHLQDETVRVPGDGLAAEARDQRALPTSAASGGASAWQIATASASAAWWGFGGSASPRIAFTMRCTCSFSARP